MRRTMALLALALLAGCEPTRPPAPPAPSPPTMSGSPMKAGVAAAAEAPIGMRVDLYHLQVPAGTVSGNEVFWKRIDEEVFAPRTYEMMYRNGVRVGQAPIAEWDRFQQVMSEHPALWKQTSLVAAAAKPVEIPMRGEVPLQNLFYYDAEGRMEGVTTASSENLIALTFQQAPRRPNVMRVALCPVVRSTQKRLEMSPLNNEVEVTFKSPQRLYDLHFATEVAIDSFLVVAPSPEASSKTSIGHNFFITQGTAERLEDVLLIVPRSIRIEAAPSGKASG